MNRNPILILIIAALSVACLAGAPAIGAGGGGHGDSAASAPDVYGLEATIARTPAEETAEMILFWVVDAGIVMLVVSFALCMFRILKGPTLIDRGIATDTITLHVVGLAILLTIGLRSLLYFDAVLIFAIIGFATTLAFAQFVGRRRAV